MGEPNRCPEPWGVARSWGFNNVGDQPDFKKITEFVLEDEYM